MEITTKRNNIFNDQSGRIVIFPIGLILFVILLVIGLIMYVIQLFQAGGLTEHSSCSQYNQASPTAQHAVIETMLTNHGSSLNADLEQMPVNAFCDGNPGKPIDGMLDQFNVNP